MPHFLVEYREVGTPETREAHRSAHISYRKGLGDAMILAGPILDNEGKSVGSLVILDRDDHDDATAAANEDPFVSAKVLELVSVRSYRIAAIKLPRS